MSSEPAPLPVCEEPSWKANPVLRRSGVVAALYLLACSAAAFFCGGIREGNGYMLPSLAGLAGALFLWVGALVRLVTAGAALWRKQYSKAIAFSAAAALLVASPFAALMACKAITRYTELWSLKSVGLAALRAEAASLVSANNAEGGDVANVYTSTIAPNDIPPTFKKIVPSCRDLHVSAEGVFFITDGLASVRSGYLVTPAGCTRTPQKSPLGGERMTVRQITDGVFYVSVSG